MLIRGPSDNISVLQIKKALLLILKLVATHMNEYLCFHDVPGWNLVGMKDFDWNYVGE